MATVKPVLHGKSVEAGTPDTQGTPTGLNFSASYRRKDSPFDAVEWEKRTALIGNEKGRYDLPPGKRRSSKKLVANGDEHCRQQIFSRQARQPGA